MTSFSCQSMVGRRRVCVIALLSLGQDRLKVRRWACSLVAIGAYVLAFVSAGYLLVQLFSFTVKRVQSVCPKA